MFAEPSDLMSCGGLGRIHVVGLSVAWLPHQSCCRWTVGASPPSTAAAPKATHATRCCTAARLPCSDCRPRRLHSRCRSPRAALLLPSRAGGNCRSRSATGGGAQASAPVRLFSRRPGIMPVLCSSRLFFCQFFPYEPRPSPDPAAVPAAQVQADATPGPQRT